MHHKDLDIRATIGRRKIDGESSIVRGGKLVLKECSRNIVAFKADLLGEASFVGSCDDSVDCEEE